MAGNLTLAAAAAAVAAVALNETFALLRPCLSAPPSHFQNDDVGIEIQSSLEVNRTRDCGCCDSAGNIYCVYWIRYPTPLSSTWNAAGSPTAAAVAKCIAT